MAVSAAALLGGSGCGGSATSALPAPITLAGIGGVRPGMHVQEVEERWGKLRLREVILGSDSDAYAPVCADPLRGWTHFYGPNGGPFWLKEIHFVAGARTDSGIGIGSTRDDVKRAYGVRLQPRKRSDSLMLLGRKRRGQLSRYAIVFVFEGRRVDQIIFGFRDEITEARRTSDGQLVRCGA